MPCDKAILLIQDTSRGNRIADCVAKCTDSVPAGNSVYNGSGIEYTISSTIPLALGSITMVKVVDIRKLSHLTLKKCVGELCLAIALAGQYLQYRGAYMFL